MTDSDIQHVLTFWFEEHNHTHWFGGGETFDAKIRKTLKPLHKQAAAGELFAWRESPKGRLAEIILLDQCSRNLYRHDARAYAYDGMALIMAQEAVSLGVDKKLSQTERWFLYLPYMHSESLRIHEEALRLFTELGMPDVLEYEHKHRHIITRFGRYPHRNAVLGRPSTSEELAFLKEAGSSF